jgi:transcriptional regulator with XRE-family HTH domain
MENDYLKNIKNIRIEKGISQKDMANKLQFAQSNYNKIENGLSELTVKRLYEIAEILGVSVFQILIDKDVEILQEKIKFEIETKKREEFNAKELERLKDKYRKEFEVELSESVKIWLDDVGKQITNATRTKKTKTKEEREKITNDRFEGYK